MKICTVVGARPQFIKAAVVSHELRKVANEILIHTGQHYDYNMSDMFFEELSIPHPDYNLGIAGGTHAEMTAKMLVALEKTFLQESPDWVLVYGDTNSALAASLSASKLHIPLCHVEAGARTHELTNPEEINRLCTDHISTKLFACTENSLHELQKENLGERAVLVGDPMYDAFLQYSKIKKINEIVLQTLDGNKISVPEKYYYLTCHREENTNKENALYEIFKAMNALSFQTIYPVHPRNKKRAFDLQKKFSFKNILLVEPVGYLESTALVLHAEKIVTDSGGLQREAFFAKKQCVTVLDFKVWPETMIGNMNALAKPIAKDITEKLSRAVVLPDENYAPFGNGSASKNIVQAIRQ